MLPTTDYRRILAEFSHRHATNEVFRAFVRMAACALAAGTREKEYLEEAKNWTREELNRFGAALGALIAEMEDKPFTDVLGTYHMESLGKTAMDRNGEFHTPQSICELMARLVVGDGPAPAEGPITFTEPACGSGATILAYANALPPRDVRRLRVTAIDINAIACDLCFINTTLWGIPATILHGNTLSLKFWAQWQNVHAICPFLHHLIPAQASAEPVAPAASLPAAIAAAAAVEQGQPPAPAFTAQLTGKLEQLGFSFAVEEAESAA